jgi:hypothetical protein
MNEAGPEGVPTFEEWIEFCFSGKQKLTDEDTERFFLIDGHVLARYFIRLFQDAREVLVGKSEKQIAEGLWLIFGSHSSYWFDIRDKDVDEGLQVQAVRSMVPLYRHYFDLTCDAQGARPAAHTNDFNDLDGAVYMLWDMNCLEGAAMFPGEEYLVDPIFEVLETALGCRTVACQISALHGLGHLQSYHPKRVQGIIDRFLRSGQEAASWVKDYARQARKGMVL